MAKVIKIHQRNDVPSQLNHWLASLAITLAEIERMDIKASDAPFIVDQAARLRAAKQKIEEIDKAVGSILKAVIDDDSKMEGDYFVACLQVVEKNVLNTDKIKKFLGKKLPNYQVVQTVRSILFKPKV